MDNNFVGKDLPVVNSKSGSEVHDIQRLNKASCDLLGAVVVGGLYGADCFEDIGELQAEMPDRK